MMNTTRELYRNMFRDYPDVMNAKQVSDVLGVSTKTVYKLMNKGAFESLKVGREFRVAKVVLMQYVKALGGAECA